MFDRKTNHFHTVSQSLLRIFGFFYAVDFHLERTRFRPVRNLRMQIHQEGGDQYGSDRTSLP